MNPVLFLLLAAGLLVANILCGGFRVGYAMPAYILLAGGACLSVFRFPGKALGWPSRFCLIAMTLCFGYLAVRGGWSPHPLLARSQVYLALGALAAYFLSALYVTDGRHRAMLVALLLFAGVANVGVGAVQFFKAHDFMLLPLMPRSESYGSRASGFFLSPNSLAGFLEICLLMGIAMVWWGRWSIYAKLLGGYACAVCLGGIVITGSRGGYLSTGFGLLIVVCISAFVSVRRLRERGLMVLLGVVCVLLAGGWAVQKGLEESYLLQTRASSMLLTEKDTRVALWRAAVKQFMLSPVTGTGGGTYLYYGRQYRADFVQTDPMVTHNDYLQVLAEYGIVGLVAILLVLFEHLRHGLGWIRRTVLNDSRVVDTQSNSLALTIGAVSCVGAYMVHSVLDFNLQIPANALVMACLFGFLAVPVRSGRDAEGSPWIERVCGALTVVIGLGLATVLVPKIPTEFARETARVLDARWMSPDDNAQIEKEVRKGLQRTPNDADLQGELGKTLLTQSRTAENPVQQKALIEGAVEAYRKASELAPGDVMYAVFLAQALDAAGRFEEAEKVFARAMVLDPNSGWVHWAYGVHFHLQHDLDRAQAEYKRSSDLFFPPGTHGYQKVVQERQAAQKP